MANEIAVTIKGEDKLSDVSKKAKDNAVKDADAVAKGFEQAGKRVVNEFGLWQDAAGKWRHESGRFASQAEKDAAGVANAFQAAGNKAGGSFKKMAQDSDESSSKIREHFGSAFGHIHDGVGRLGSFMTTALGTAVGVIGAQIVTSISQPFHEFISGSVPAASELADSMNAVNRVFGESADKINFWGDNVANNFGLSQRAFNQLATPLGAMLKNAGLGMEDVAEQTLQVTMRAADMASVFGGDVESAMQAIQAGLRGEADPLERYGVGLSAAAVEAHALAMGLGEVNVDQDKVSLSRLRLTIATDKYNEAEKKHGGSATQTLSAWAAVLSAQEAYNSALEGGEPILTDQAKMLARIDLLMKQTADTTGDHVAASDEHANAIKNDNARMEEQQALLGQALIPLSMKASEMKLKLAEALVQHGIPAFEKFQAIIGEHVTPRLKDFGGWIRDQGIPAVQELVGWVRDNVVPVLQDFGNWVRQEGIPAVQDFGGWLRENLAPAMGKLRDAFSDAQPKVEELWRRFKEDVVPVIRDDLYPNIKAFAEFMFQKVIPAVIDVSSAIMGVLIPAVGHLVTFWGSVIQANQTLLRSFDDLWEGIKSGFVAAVNWIIDVWNGINFPGVTIPGTGIEIVPSFSTPDIGKIGAPNASGGDRQVGGGGIRRFASGGITNGPMLAVVGDNPGGREAIIPLPPGGGGIGGDTYHVYALSAEMAAEGVARAYEMAKRRGLIR